MDDGVYQLTNNQSTDDIGMKNFSKTYAALGDYDINQIYVCNDSLAERGLTADDLQALIYEDEDDDWAEKSSMNFCSKAELADLIDDADVLLNF